MKVTDYNLAKVLQTLTPAERRAVELALRPAGPAPESETLQNLQRAAIRKIKARLKRRARSKPDPKFRWLN